MIARIDDSTQACIENLRQHNHFDFVLKTRLTWSKNVREERDAPWQTVIASMNPVYCVHLNIALWLEVFLTESPAHAAITPYLFPFNNDIQIPAGGVKSKSFVQRALSKIFAREEFQSDAGPCGSHSIRKYASTHVRNCGATKDEKDL